MCSDGARRAGGSSRGFTLIELMIVVAVVALLAAVALPSYQGAVRKAHRTDAKTALTTAAQQMERSFTENSNYTTAALGTTFAANSENGYYALTFAASPARTANTYMLVATPQGAQAGDACGNFMLDQSGARTVSGSLSVADCW